MRYRVVVEQDAKDEFSASVPGLPGCHSQGATEQEALDNVATAIREYLEVVRDLTAGRTVREVEVEA